MLTLRSNGYWLHGLGPIGDLQYTFARSATGGGLLTVSWSMVLPTGFTHPALRKGAIVELMAGPMVLGVAEMTEPDRDGWTFTADGFAQMAGRMAAVDATGMPSTDLSVIVPAAITRGWPWRNPGGLPVGSLSTASEDSFNGNYVADVLNEYCRINGKRWWIDPDRYLRIDTDPTAVDWALLPGTPAMATADDDYRSRLFGRFVTAMSGTPPVPSAWDAVEAEDAAAGPRWGQSEEIVDLTPLGVIADTAATDALEAMLASGTARPAFTQAVELVRGQVITPGGTPPELWQVAASVPAGAVVRHHGVLDSEGSIGFGRTLEWMAGSATHNVSERKLTLAPFGLAPRTLSQVFAVQAPRTEFA